jgi:hypothetical protein
MVRDAQSGRLAGVTAVYDLLARPGEGRFSFVSDQALTDPDEPTATLHSTQHLLLEGMRRYDELVRATAVVPDDARYMPSDTPPTKPDPSMSGESVARVWARASAGASPAECERSLGLDAYQIRACFAHWVDTGALVAHDG